MKRISREWYDLEDDFNTFGDQNSGASQSNSSLLEDIEDDTNSDISGQSVINEGMNTLLQEELFSTKDEDDKSNDEETDIDESVSNNKNSESESGSDSQNGGVSPMLHSENSEEDAEDDENERSMRLEEIQ